MISEYGKLAALADIFLTAERSGAFNYYKMYPYVDELRAELDRVIANRPTPAEQAISEVEFKAVMEHLSTPGQPPDNL